MRQPSIVSPLAGGLRPWEMRINEVKLWWEFF